MDIDVRREVFNGIKEVINDEENYFFDFDNGRTATYILLRGTETKNFVIDIELEVTVAVHDTLGLVLVDMNLNSLNVVNDKGEEVEINYTDKQIKDLLILF